MTMLRFRLKQPRGLDVNATQGMNITSERVQVYVIGLTRCYIQAINKTLLSHSSRVHNIIYSSLCLCKCTFYAQAFSIYLHNRISFVFFFRGVVTVFSKMSKWIVWQVATPLLDRQGSASYAKFAIKKKCTKHDFHFLLIHITQPRLGIQRVGSWGTTFHNTTVSFQMVQ